MKTGLLKYSVFSLLVIAGVMACYAGYPAGYYDRMDGKKKEALKDAVKQSVETHERLVYSQLPGVWQYTDVYPELVNGCKRWWDMYSDEMCIIAKNQNPFQSFSSYGMQREHSVPKSWWKKNGDVEYTPAYSDLWNLYPSNGEANQAKSNYPFAPTDRTTYTNGVTKVGYPRAGYGGGASRVFEPADEYKGDFARAIFYMACVYDQLPWVINYMFRQESWPTLQPWAYNMLLQWARTDKVSQKEIDRNNLVEQYQGNRNPFIDFPELAEYIWGVRTEETFLISEQVGSDPTPPITGDPTITSPVTGETLDFGQVAVGYSVTRGLQIQGSNFTSPLSLRVVGADSDYFIPEETSIPASTLNANGGYILNVTYAPSQLGSHQAKITLYDGGLDGSVAVNLVGEALEVPQMEVLTALDPINVSDNSYTARWNAPTGIADYYVVKRIKYYNDNQEADEVETGSTQYTFTDREQGIAESYSVRYSRLGILSPESNTIYVAASGVAPIYDKLPYRVFNAEGGAIILTGDGEGIDNLSVYDMQGRSVMSPRRVADGEIIPLAAGIYLLYAPGYRPTRIIVQ